MKNTGLIILAAVSTGLSAQLFAQENRAIRNPAISNPAVQSPVGGGTTPVSQYQSGLRRTPNPIMPQTGNLVVTGNVAGGKHFRGVVPYNAATDLGSALGATPMDSFLRDSAGASGYGVYDGGIRPYYFERRTVTGLRPGTTEVYRPPAPKVSYGTPAGLLEPQLDKPQILQIRPVRATQVPLRPLAMTDWQEALERELAKYPQYVPPEEGLTEEEYQEQMSKLREDLRDLSDKTKELKQSLLIEEKGEEVEEVVPQQPLRPFEPGDKEAREKEETLPDIYERLDRQTEEFQKMMEERRLKAEEEAGKEPEEAEEAPQREEDEAEQQQRQRPAPEELSPFERAARARGILGEHETFESFAAARFKAHIADGNRLLKEGKYYQAADSYTMASLYNRNDADASAGKSYALFAAGEYMSSALFLARALEAPGDYVNQKVDILAVIGDRDRVENRVVDAEDWLKKSQAPELQFLLSYMYYRLGRMPQAQTAIDGAFEKMADSPAVAELKKAIEAAAQ